MDKREDILQRLLAIMTLRKDAGDYVTVARNQGVKDNAHRPAVVLTDGGESTQLTAERVLRPGVFRTQLMRMEPKIFILPKEDRPQNDTIENIGTTVNTLRVAMCAAIATDTQLAALIGSNGWIVLNSTETDLESGAAMSGEMALGLSIVYPFNPTT